MTYRHPMQSDRTLDGYPDETDACRALDSILNAAYQVAFKVRAEVHGQRLLYPVNKDRGGEPRIDRFLFPTTDADMIGWELGAIGIEVKKSGQKIGPVIEQVLDYSHSLFEARPGVWVACRALFIFPWACGTGTLESIAQRNSIGGVWIRPSRGTLCFTFKGQTILELDATGCPVREAVSVDGTRKFGNQGNKIRSKGED